MLPVVHSVEDIPSPSHLWSLQLLTKKEGESSDTLEKLLTNKVHQETVCCAHATPPQSMVVVWPSQKTLVQNIFGRVLLSFMVAEMIGFCDVTHTVPLDCPLSLQT